MANMTEQHSAPHISVIIPFYNRREEAATCISAVLGQKLPDGITTEVIAVDNGSNDGTLDALRKYPIRVVECATRGPAAARNAGFRAASAPIVAFTDSDCIPADDWLFHLVEPFVDDDVICTGGRIKGIHVRHGVTAFMEFNRILNNEKFFYGVLCFPPFFATANAAFRRRILEEVGGFNESLWIGEDSDLTWRAMDRGGKMAYCPKALVEHGHRETFGAFFSQAMDYGSGAASDFAMHRKRFGVRWFIEWENIGAVGLLPFEALARLFLSNSSYKRKASLYNAIWRTGFMLGKIKGSIKNRVVFL